MNHPALNSVEHFVITTNVSVVTLLVAVLTARAALQIRHYPPCSSRSAHDDGGIFACARSLDAGVLQRGDKADDASLVVGVSVHCAARAR